MRHVGSRSQVKSSGTCIVKLDRNIVRSHIDCSYSYFFISGDNKRVAGSSGTRNEALGYKRRRHIATVIDLFRHDGIVLD